MTRTADREAAALVRRSIAAIFASAVTRRHLRYESARALADLNLSGPEPSSGLPAPTLGREPDLEDQSLLGATVLDDGATHSELPLEARLVAYGARPSALLAAPVELVNALLARARAAGLVALVCPEEFLPESDPIKGGFADRATQVRPVDSRHTLDPRWWRRVVVSSSPDVAALSWLAQFFRWDAYLGTLLGYPDCCTAAFATNWPVAYAVHGGDLAAVVLDNTHTEAGVVGPVPWQTNVYARYFGRLLISYFPCDLRCPSSITLGDRLIDVLSWHEQPLARVLRDDLRAPILLTKDHGLFRFCEATLRRRGPTTSLTYASVDATDARAAALCERMRMTGRIDLVARPHGSVRVDGIPALQGRLLWFGAKEDGDALPLAS